MSMKKSVNASHQNLKTKRLLIVEDDTGTILLLRQMLSDIGEIFFSQSSSDAIMQVARLCPDLVVIGMHMQDMDGDGVDLCTALKGTPAGSYIPVVFVTASTDDESEVRAFEAGAADFIRKPLHRTIVRARISGLLSSKQRLESLLSTKTKLREQEELLRLFIENAPASMAMLDETMRHLAVSKRFLEDYGIAGQNIIGLNHYDVFGPLALRNKESHQRGLAGETVRCDEDFFMTNEGVSGWARWEITPWHSGGAIGGVLLLSEIITERKLAEQRERRLSNMYRALSEINNAILHLDSEEAIFSLACRVAIDCGGMRLAWLGTLGEDGYFIINACCGPATPFLDEVRISSRPDVPEGQGPSGTAFRQGRPVVANDIVNNGLTTRWAEKARQYEMNATSSFPIYRDGKPYALLAIYSESLDAFDNEIVELLEQMTANISFALDNIDRETARSRREEEIRTLFENASDGIFILGRGGAFLDVNERGAWMLGYTKQELLNLNITDLIDEQDRARLSKEFFQMDNRIDLCEWRNRRKDGSFMLCEVSATTLPDGRIMATLRDISERRLADNERLRALGRYQAVVENICEGVMTFDSSGAITSMNAAALRLHRFNHPDEACTELEEYQHEFELRDAEGNQLAFNDWPPFMLLRGEKVLGMELQLCSRRTGECSIMECHGSVIRSDNGDFLLGILTAHDITTRKLTEVEISQSRKRLAELSAKLIEAQEEERKWLARELHDELGQRFTTLNLNLHRLRDFIAADDAKDVWERASEEVTSLIRRVREMSGSLHPPMLDYLGLEAAVSNLLKQHFSSTSIEHVFEYVALPKKLPAPVEITVYRIVQEAITNIVRHADAARAVIEIVGSENGDDLDLVIRDDGKGFDPTRREWSGDKRTGLGLNGMRERVSVLGGELHLDSRKGRGTRIVIRIPLHRPSGKPIGQ